MTLPEAAAGASRAVALPPHPRGTFGRKVQGWPVAANCGLPFGGEFARGAGLFPRAQA